jgi:hypothetical protein
MSATLDFFEQALDAKRLHRDATAIIDGATGAVA